MNAVKHIVRPPRQSVNSNYMIGRRRFKTHFSRPTTYHGRVIKNRPDDSQPSRRTFVKKAATSIVASGALLSGCGPQEESTKPPLKRLYDDPYSL